MLDWSLCPLLWAHPSPLIAKLPKFSGRRGRGQRKQTRQPALVAGQCDWSVIRPLTQPEVATWQSRLGDAILCVATSLGQKSHHNPIWRVPEPLTVRFKFPNPKCLRRESPAILGLMAHTARCEIEIQSSDLLVGVITPTVLRTPKPQHCILPQTLG